MPTVLGVAVRPGLNAQVWRVRGASANFEQATSLDDKMDNHFLSRQGC